MWFGFFFFILSTFSKHWKFLTFCSPLYLSSHAHSPSLSEGEIKNYQTYVSTQQIMMKVAFGTVKLYIYVCCIRSHFVFSYHFYHKRKTQGEKRRKEAKKKNQRTKTEVQKNPCVCLGDELDFCLQFFAFFHSSLSLYLCVYVYFSVAFLCSAAALAYHCELMNN